MNILFFGDIMGKPGRQGLLKALPDLKLKYNADFVIANGENLSHGAGVTNASYNEIIKGGVDFLTGGNHIWAKQEIESILEQKDAKIIRPANYPPGAPGSGWKIVEVGVYKILIVNLLGRMFMKKHMDCPFRKIDEILSDDETENVKIKIIDFHAEATAEKISLGYYVDGRVSALIGTHTHIATSDARILPQKTFYMTDAGMNGVKESVLGIDKNGAIEQFLTQRPVKIEIPESDTVCINGIFMNIDYNTGLVKNFERIEKDIILEI